MHHTCENHTALAFLLCSLSTSSISLSYSGLPLLRSSLSRTFFRSRENFLSSFARCASGWMASRSASMSAAEAVMRVEAVTSSRVILLPP